MLGMFVVTALLIGIIAHATNGGDNFLCNLPTSQQPNGDVDDMSQGSGSAPKSPKDNIGFENNMKIFERIDFLSDLPEQSLNPDIDQADEGGCTSLYKAASRGQLSKVMNLVLEGADPNKANGDGRRALHVAAEKGYEDIVKFLVDQGADVNAVDDLSQTPLHAAVHNNQYLSAFSLSLKGADIYKPDNYGRTPLHVAAAAGNIQICQFLVDEICDINVEDNMGLTVLHHAMRNGHSNIVNYLLKKGANETPYGGDSLIFASASFGNLDLVKLSMASSAGHLEIVDSFLSNGAEVNEENGTGHIPLHAAAANGSLEIVEKLMNHGSNVNKTADNGWTPLHASVYDGTLDAAYLISQRFKTIFEEMTLPLVNYSAMTGCDVNDGTDTGKTPLLAASYIGDMDSVEMLVTQGACINQADRNEWTLVHAAAQEGHLPVNTYLVENGADTNAKDADGMTPLQAAEDGGHEDVKQFLIRLRADVKDELNKDTKETDGMTSLLAAEDAAHDDGQKFIIRLRAEVQDERHNAREKRIRFSGNCKEISLGCWISQVSACDILTGTNGESCYHMPFGVSDATISLSTQNSSRMNPDTHPSYIKTTIRPTRESCVAKPKSLLCGGEVPATDDLPITNENDAVDPKPVSKNLCRALIMLIGIPIAYIIKTTTHSISVSCVYKPKTQLHGGEVPDTDDFPVTEMTNENDAVNPKSGIKSEYRNNANCFSILTLLHRAILALASFFACCPILVAGNLTWPEPVTLEAGTRGVVRFPIQRPSSTLHFSLFYTIQFGSKGRPFCINGQYDIDGFKDPSQLSRFTTTVIDRDTSPCVNVTIDDVDTIDGDRYIFIGVWHSSENVLYDTQKKEVVVQRPPGPADCFITLSDSEFPYEVHCWAKTGSMPTTLACYQNDRDLVKMHNITDNWQTTRAIFLIPDTTYFSCCSHDITSTVAAATCNDFEWPPGYSGIPSTEKTTSRSRSAGEQSNRPTDPTFLTYITSDVGSGACRSSIIPSQWHFLYLLMYLLAFVIMC